KGDCHLPVRFQDGKGGHRRRERKRVYAVEVVWEIRVTIWVKVPDGEVTGRRRKQMTTRKPEWLNSMKYIREKYGVPIKRGAKVKINKPASDLHGVEGRVTSAVNSMVVRVKLDGWDESVCFDWTKLIFLAEE